MKRYILGILGALAIVSAAWAGEITDLDTTDASNTNASYGFPENMAPSAVNDNARAFQGIIARWYEDWRGSIVAYGSANAVRITPNRTVSALEDGLLFAFEATASNTGATTFQVGSLAAKTIKKVHDQDLASGDLEQGMKAVVVYNADEDVFQILTPVANTVSNTDETVKVTSDDTTAGYLFAKVASGSGITISETNGGGDEDMTIAVAITSNSSGLEFHSGKLRIDAGTGIALDATGANLDINGLTEVSAAASSADFVVLYDASATDNRKITVENLLSTFPAPSFTSAEQSVTVDSQLDIAHSLPATPVLVVALLKNVTADAGYTPGTEIIVGTTFNESADVKDHGITVWADQTNVSIVTGEDMALLSRTTFNHVELTEARWRYIVKAWN